MVGTRLDDLPVVDAGADAEAPVLKVGGSDVSVLRKVEPALIPEDRLEEGFAVTAPSVEIVCG